MDVVTALVSFFVYDQLFNVNLLDVLNAVRVPWCFAMSGIEPVANSY